jgi:hypothetical protein
MAADECFPEEEYYERILQKYKERLDGENNNEVRQYMALELTSLMRQMESSSTLDKDAIDSIGTNIMILLLSLFEDKDSSTNYTNFQNLSEKEQTKVKKVLQFTISQ